MQITDLHIRRIFQALTALVLIIGAFLIFPSLSTVKNDLPFASTLDSTQKKFLRPEHPKASYAPTSVINSNAPFRTPVERGDYFLSQGLYEDAVNAYRDATEFSPTDVGLYVKLGDALSGEKKFPLAEQSYEIAYTLAPADQIVAVKYVRSMLAQRKVIETNSILEAVNPPTAESLLYRGIVTAFLNKSEDSKKFLQDAVAKNDPATVKKARLILDAYTQYELATDADTVYLQALLAKTFDELEEYELAIALGLEAIKTQNDYRDIWVVLGHSYLNQHKWADAESALLKAIRLDSQKALSYALLGFAEEGLNKRIDAIGAFETALRLNHEPRIQMKQKLAENYFLSNQFDRALRYYEDILNTEVNAIDINFYVRPIFISIEKIKDARKALALAKSAFIKHPNDAMAYNLLGWAYDALLDDTQAETNLLRALELNPRLSAAHLNIGRLYERQGKFEQAKEFYQYAVAFAEELGDDSIGSTAKNLYNKLVSAESNKPLP